MFYNQVRIKTFLRNENQTETTEAWTALIAEAARGPSSSLESLGKERKASQPPGLPLSANWKRETHTFHFEWIMAKMWEKGLWSHRMKSTLIY